MFAPFFFCVGEVERLLKEYRQNQELVRKIGGHFYQIIYPVQLRHHEKMGISTREVGGSKVRFSLGRRNIMNSTVCQFIHSFIYSYTFYIKVFSLTLRVQSVGVIGNNLRFYHLFLALLLTPICSSL
jgi:hypothetical protein